MEACRVQCQLSANPTQTCLTGRYKSPSHQHTLLIHTSQLPKSKWALCLEWVGDAGRVGVSCFETGIEQEMNRLLLRFPRFTNMSPFAHSLRWEGSMAARIYFRVSKSLSLSVKCDVFNSTIQKIRMTRHITHNKEMIVI